MLRGGCGPSVSDEVDALGEDAFFPALLLGSPLGYRTEIGYNFWTPTLFATMVEQLVPAAFGAGIRSVVAPWVPDRPGNEALTEALDAAGGHSIFWGFEDHIPLAAASWDEHLVALPKKKRQRVVTDERRVAAAGVTMQRLDGAAIRPHIPRIAELTCLNREKNGAGENPAHIETMLAELLDAGADLRAYTGSLDGELVASCVVIRKGHRLLTKWAGFDYARLGERSGLYFPLVLNAPVRDAYREGLRQVEFGAGAHQAKVLRGCSSRRITTSLVLADAAHRERAHALLDAFGAARRVAFGDVVAPSPLPLLETTASGSACCSGG
ncbi:GNAT family N-acetyltransferase [Polymorphospora rubra]|uniref:BioF2-like acetyltransferase domain-containing protein n=1 Tax=Polymorphospora rubra TaxID=338584 RepID=A0A810N422_9ACTN|nr:GNAT family N-acetyltransferase [Polymorphospora rubra]BCJ68077.1 hypothetical protein Prubr_50980 [Polymorphospora rubra]